jgi:hypothetical protein
MPKIAAPSDALSREWIKMKYRVDFEILDADKSICILSAAGSTLETAICCAMEAAGPHLMMSERSVRVVRVGFYCEQCKGYHGFDELRPIHVALEVVRSEGQGECPGN